MTPGLLEGNVSLITINRAGIQKATAALISFKVHTHPICAQKELNRSRKNKFSLVTGAAQKGGWWQVLADPRHSISACVRVGEMASSGMSCSCLELVPCQPNWWFWSKIVKLKKKIRSLKLLIKVFNFLPSIWWPLYNSLHSSDLFFCTEDTKLIYQAVHELKIYSYRQIWTLK